MPAGGVNSPTTNTNFHERFQKLKHFNETLQQSEATASSSRKHAKEAGALETEPTEQKASGGWKHREQHAQQTTTRSPCLQSRHVQPRRIPPPPPRKHTKTGDRREESTATESIGATPRFIHPCSAPPAQHIPETPPPPFPEIPPHGQSWPQHAQPWSSHTQPKLSHDKNHIRPPHAQSLPPPPPLPIRADAKTKINPGAMDSAHTSDASKVSDQTRKPRLVLPEERFNNRGASEPRQNGEASRREKHVCAPTEKAPRKRDRSEPVTSANHSQRKQRKPVEAGGDASHTATRESSAPTGAREQEHFHSPYREGSFHHIMEKASREFPNAIQKTKEKLYRDYNEQYYSEDDFSAHYGLNNGQMCYECSKYATMETISALKQMRAHITSFSSLRSGLESWLREKEDGQKGKFIFDLLYVILKYRAQYFWQNHGNLLPAEWTHRDLGGERREVWKFVKIYASEQQGLVGDSQIAYLISRCTPRAKTTSLVKLIVEKGVSDDGDWKSAITRCEYNL